MDTLDTSQESHYNHVQSSHLTVKGTISANKIKKRVGIFNIFGSNKVSWSLFCRRHCYVAYEFLMFCLCGIVYVRDPLNCFFFNWVNVPMTRNYIRKYSNFWCKFLFLIGPKPNPNRHLIYWCQKKSLCLEWKNRIQIDLELRIDKWKF